MMVKLCIYIFWTLGLLNFWTYISEQYEFDCCINCVAVKVLSLVDCHAPH